MLKDPKAGKVKSGVRQLVNKLAEASAIRSAQARTIAQEIAHSPYPSVIVCGDFNDSRFRMPTGSSRKIWTMLLLNRDAGWASHTTRINSISGLTIFWSVKT